MDRKETVFEGVRRLVQEGGKTLSWHESSGVKLLEKDGLLFKDLERSGELLPYEDWRLDAKERAADLASRLSIEEIAGLMLYSPHQMVPPRPGMPFGGTYGGKSFDEAGCPAHTLSDQQRQFIERDHIRHILMVMVQNAATAARWTNELQRAAESQPHGIPVNLSSDPRSGARSSAAEYKSAGDDVSKWPEGVGFAACFDPDVVRQFAHDASLEYRALGITTALGPQIDLCTEPRWMRFMDTLGEDLASTKALVKAYCDGMQTTEGSPDGWGKDSVNTMVKHWPGGGTGEGGRDAHYAFGKYAVYPADNAAEHEKPFTEAAFALDGPTKCASAVMPYYTVSWGVDRKYGRNVGNSYSEYLIRDRLRGELGYDGVVCTDWDITRDPDPEIDSFGSRCHNMDGVSEAERHLICILNGVDQFGGNDDPRPILEAYRLGCERIGEEAMRARMEEAARRLLVNIFRCGLFEDPYLDPAESEKIVGCEEFTRHGYEAQCRSVVLLKNWSGTLPLAEGLKIYVPVRHVGPSVSFMRDRLPAYDADPVPDEIIARYGTRVMDPAEADAAIVFAESPASTGYLKEDREAGGNGYVPVTLQYRPYTAEAAREHSIAGGDWRESSPDRSYKGKTNTCWNEADLDNILRCREVMGNKPVIVVETLSNPMVVSEFERSVDALIADFGVSRSAVLDVIFGRYAPRGRLPIQMPRDMETVEKHCEDKPFDLEVHVDECGSAYDFGFGLGYDGKPLG